MRDYRFIQSCQYFPYQPPHMIVSSDSNQHPSKAFLSLSFLNLQIWLICESCSWLFLLNNWVLSLLWPGKFLYTNYSSEAALHYFVLKLLHFGFHCLCYILYWKPYYNSNEQFRTFFITICIAKNSLFELQKTS